MGLLKYAMLSGWTMARSHARSADPQVISGSLGKSARFDSALAKFAVRYADQNDSDYQVSLAAAQARDIPIQPE